MTLSNALAPAALAALAAGPSFAAEFAVASPAPIQWSAALDVSAATQQFLVLPPRSGERFFVEIDLDGDVHTLDLEPLSMRAPDFRLWVANASGELVEAPAPAPSTYTGEVAGLEGSQVRASLRDGGLQATIWMPDNQVFSIEPARSVSPSADADLHIVYDGADNLPDDHGCGVQTEDVEVETTLGGPTGGLAGTGQGNGDTIVEIACDADFSFYQKNGFSVSNTVADVEFILAGVEAIYQPQASITWVVGDIIVRSTSGSDPYTTNDSSGLLNEFRTEWLTNQTAIHRDVAHLFTGRNLSGNVIGVAWLGGICSGTTGFGLSESRYTTNNTRRISLTAHELGHNWTANHCNGDSDCEIMCSSNGGCGDPTPTNFGQAALNSLETKKSANCLENTDPPPGPDPIPPTISSIDPNVLPSVVPGLQKTVSIVGANMSLVTEVLVDGKALSNFPPEFEIVDDSTLTLAMPLQTGLGEVEIELVNPFGSDTITIEIEAASPPRLELGEGNAPEPMFSILPTVLTLGGQPGNIMILAASGSNVPTSVPGLFDLDLGNNLTQLIVLQTVVVDAKGWVQVSYQLSGFPFGASLYFQAIEYNPITGILPVESTNLSEGSWVF